MKRLPLLTALAGSLLLVASCKNANKAGLAIPKDAAAVFYINAGSLSSKLSWDDIKKTEWFKDAYNENKDSFAQKMMNNPDASGIDLSKDFVYFIRKRGRSGYGVLEGSVKDEAAFGALLKKTDSAAKTEKDGNVNVAYTNGGVAAWNNNMFALVSNAHMTAVAPAMGEPSNVSTDSLKLFAKQALNGEGGSLFDDDRFASVMKEAGDMHFWVNSGLLYTDMAGMVSMMKVGSLIEDNAMAGVINFDDGKITGRLKQFYGKEMQKAIDKWKFRNVDASVLNRIPSDNVIGVMAMNVDPAAIKDFLKTIGMDGMANMALSEQHLSLDDLLNATKGQLVMAVSDLQMKDTTVNFETANGLQSHTSSKPDMSVLFATDVNQKTSLQKLLDVAKPQLPEGLVTYQLNNDWFVAGNKPDAVNGFAAGGNKKHPFADKLSGHPFGFYLNIQQLLKANLTNDAAAKSLLAESATIWQDMVMVAGEYKNGVATSELTINMVDGKTNSLKQLNQYIETMHSANKARKVAMEKDRQNMPADSMTTMTEPPPAVVERKQ